MGPARRVTWDAIRCNLRELACAVRHERPETATLIIQLSRTDKLD
jgi:hypothetical protein